MMKKLLKWVLPTFIGIVPTLGMEQALIEGKIALSQPKVIFSVRDTVTMKDNLIARVDITPNTGEPKLVKVKAHFDSRNWLDQIDKDGAYGQETGILYDSDLDIVLSENYILPKIHRYNETSSPVLTASINLTPVIEPFSSLKIIPFGAPVDVCQKGEYERPGGSKCKMTNEYTIIAKGLHDGQELTTLEDFFNLDFGTIVDVHSAIVESGDDATVSDNDPVLYQIFIKESLNKFSHWECGGCYSGGNSFKGKKQYHTAIGYDYTTAYKQLMIRLPGKEDIAYPNGQRELSKTKIKNGNNNNESGNHDNPRPEFTLI